jgi:hypothetical protein
MANPAAVTMIRMANRQQHRRTALLNAVMTPSIYLFGTAAYPASLWNLP